MKCNCSCPFYDGVYIDPDDTNISIEHCKLMACSLDQIFESVSYGTLLYYSDLTEVVQDENCKFNITKYVNWYYECK